MPPNQIVEDARRSTELVWRNAGIQTKNPWKLETFLKQPTHSNFQAVRLAPTCGKLKLT